MLLALQPPMTDGEEKERKKSEREEIKFEFEEVESP